MEYFFENFTFPPDQSFTIRTEELEIKMHTCLKCHVNYEIALLENTRGKRFIGDHIEDFSGPELVLIGSYLPHCWQFYSELDKHIRPHVYVLHFFPDFMGKELLTKPEAQSLSELFDNAFKGIRFSGPTIAEARPLLKHLLYAKGLQRMSYMLQLLDVLARSPHQQTLASPGFNSVENSKDADRINKVYGYIFNHFREDITLSQVSSLVHMSPAAFCRYFKAKTSRTLIDFIKEVRIGYAAKLLIGGKHNITEACYDSGHNNLSNFNKHFKELKGLTPTDFIKQCEGVALA